MNNLNSVLLEGIVTDEPVLSKTPKDTSVCTFRITVCRYYRQDEETIKEESFFYVETWRRLAEYCNAQLKPGIAIRIVGRLNQDRWEEEEGKWRSQVKVVAEHIEIQKL